MDREETLSEAIRLTMNDRNESYDDPLRNHTRIAKIWSIILGVEIDAAQVALCMVGLKLARLAYKYDDDSFIDLCAYAAIANEVRQ
jgi:Domain of unknown function (DUF6378)